MLESKPRRLSLLYQLYLANQAARRFMKVALAGVDITGEEYALYSFLYANGPRTQSEMAHHLGMAVTTLATALAPLVVAGEIERWPHPTDRRARLLDLTDAGRERLKRAIPAFSRAYRGLLAELEAASADPDAIYAALDELRNGIAMTLSREALAEGRERPA